MSAGTHTPGPWRINEFGEVIGGDGRKLLASGVSLTSGNHDDADMAAENARLIAAAPDMFTALTAAYVQGDLPTKVRAMVYDALAKAKGAL